MGFDLTEEMGLDLGMVDAVSEDFNIGGSIKGIKLLPFFTECEILSREEEFTVKDICNSIYNERNIPGMIIEDMAYEVIEGYVENGIVSVTCEYKDGWTYVVNGR
ncbi:MAG: hypothetical protein N4A47_05705 [Clostridia bacterium]|jgi:hypothetical protein|nr:hypothetical protein [Clostridia bacterium]